MRLSIDPVPADDLEAIQDVVAAIQSTQRSESVDGFLDLFDERAVWTTSGGVRLIGLPAIREFTERVLPGAMKDLQEQPTRSRTSSSCALTSRQCRLLRPMPTTGVFLFQTTPGGRPCT
jgi:hypothetical protein